MPRAPSLDGAVQPAQFPFPGFPDYALLDSGGGEKLERYGAVRVRRPDPQALWRRRLDEQAWRSADLAFERDPSSGGRRGRWIAGARAAAELRVAEPRWSVRWQGAVCVVRPTPFKHLGLFPEQAANWAWIGARAGRFDARQPRLLNLFGYTGLASIVAVGAGYEVTHVDASRSSLAWARENARASGLEESAFRVVLEDARAFCAREVRRGARYEAVLLDPPHHGRGPKGETWQFEEHLAELLESCGRLLAERAFLVLSAYAFGTSPLALANLLADLPPGEVQAGELALPEEVGEAATPPRSLPCGFCARYTRGLA